MKLCINCNEPVPQSIEIDGKQHRLHNRKYCLTCSPFEPAASKKHEKACRKCGENIPLYINLADGRKISTQRRKFCLKCSPYGEHNTKDLNKAPNPRPSIKRCPYCEKSKSLEDFYEIRRRGRTEPSVYCKICTNYITVQRHRKLKIEAVAYLGGKCVKCGYSKCIAALEFHHPDPSQKDPGLIGKGMTRFMVGKMAAELDKCLLVCVNCHREAHQNLERKISKTIQKQRDLKKEAVKYLGDNCTKCNYAACMGALEFHHLDPSQKDPVLSRKKSTAFEIFKSELDKCILVCANCHREIHWEMQSTSPVVEDTNEILA